MLTRSGASNPSRKSVTTLIVSIGLFHGDEVLPPRLDVRARLHPDERQQPLAVVCAPPRHDQRPSHDLTLFVHHQQPGLRREHRTRVLHEGEHGDLPPLPVRLAHAADYAGRLRSTPAFFSSDRTGSGRSPGVIDNTIAATCFRRLSSALTDLSACGVTPGNRPSTCWSGPIACICFRATRKSARSIPCFERAFFSSRCAASASMVAAAFSTNATTSP